MSRLTLPLFTLTGVLALAAPAFAQGSGSSRLNQPGSRPPTYSQPRPSPSQPAPAQVQPRAVTPEEYYRSLWRYLIRPQSPYTQWSPLPDKAGLRKATSPHGAFVRLCANATALADPKNLPYGSVLVLEDYSEDRKTRTDINVLYRVKGYDPKNGDWYWLKYHGNGTVARTPAEEGGKPIAGRALGCIECHRKAADKDMVFSNDPAPVPAKENNDGDQGVQKKDSQNKPQASTFGRDWPATDRLVIDAIGHGRWDALLKRYVDTSGTVDYARWKRSTGDLRALGEYLDELSRADPALPSSRAARLTFWINAYNALTVRGILRDDSISNAPQRPEPRESSQVLLRIAGRAYTPDEIENDFLRKLGDSRIHFAIVCGARGCPRLRQEAYAPSKLEEQLLDNAQAFFADPTKFRSHLPEGHLELSAILDWYGTDFGKNPAELLKAIAPYLPDETSRRLAASGDARVSYLDYDWQLNETTDRPTKVRSATERASDAGQ